jgi:hypothetical protein
VVNKQLPTTHFIDRVTERLIMFSDWRDSTVSPHPESKEKTEADIKEKS